VEEQLIAHIPLGRMGEAERDIGGAVVMLSSSEAGYVTGQTIMVNGGA
jgi:NAD(P)-dependent dehydrogenase (short-subunit alcohol dehydrogenase family)